MQQTKCILCDRDVVATDDDDSPKCDECQGEWADSLAVRAIMAGEMDHLIPELQEPGGDQ